MREIGVTIKKRIPCMNNSVEVLTPFSEGNQGLLKLHVHFGWGVPVWGKWGCVMLHCFRKIQSQQLFTTTV